MVKARVLAKYAGHENAHRITKPG